MKEWGGNTITVAIHLNTATDSPQKIILKPHATKDCRFHGWIGSHQFLLRRRYCETVDGKMLHAAARCDLSRNRNFIVILMEINEEVLDHFVMPWVMSRWVLGTCATFWTFSAMMSRLFWRIACLGSMYVFAYFVSKYFCYEFTIT